MASSDQYCDRRTNLEKNFYMTAAVALIPSNVLKIRKGRAVMLVKMAADMGARLEDSGKGPRSGYL